MTLLAELKRRNVFRVAIYYVVSGWLVLQIADLIFEVLLVPDWTLRFMFGALVAAFPFAMFLAWAYEVTPEGIKREADVDRSRPTTNDTARKLDRVTAGLLLILLAALAYDRFGPQPTAQPDAVAAESVATTATVGQAAPADDDRRSIAVLPFANMTVDENNEVLSDGISEEILNTLAKIPALKVAARTSSFQFKGRNEDISVIAAALRVEHVLEGSVRRAGDRIRITAQLIQASDGFHMWSETYDRQLDDIFAIQDEIAASIAAALKTTLNLASSSASGNHTGTTSLQAYELYLEGMQQWHLREAASLLRARSLFEEAIAIDPGFAKAHAGLALVEIVISSYLSEDERSFQADAGASARRAIELDPENAEAHAALALMSEPTRADRYFERAIELKPSFATAYQWRGTLVQAFGEGERGLALMHRAHALDPRSRIIGNNLARAYWALERYDEALAALAEVEAYAPGYNETQESEFGIRLFMGDMESARKAGEALARSLGKEPDAVPVYLALFDPATRESAVATVMDWPWASRRNPESPVLLYEFNLILLLARAGFEAEAEAVLQGLVEHRPTVAIYALGHRSIHDFYCRDAVRQLITELGYGVSCPAGDS